MRSKIIKSTIAALAFGLMFTSFAGCTRKLGNVDNNAVVGITQEPGIFDPHTVVAAGDREIIFNVYEGLYKYDSKGNLNPCLATDVAISDDASVYTFTLREGVKFHDGSDFDAADVVYSLKRAAGLLDNQDGVALVGELDSIKDVKATAEGKVEVTLEAGNTELLSYFTTGIIPENYDNCQTAPVGTGPFKFDSYNPGQNVILVKNDNYWQKGLPYLDKVTFKVCADMDAGLTELASGSIDIFPYLTTDRANQLDKAKYNILSNGSNMVQIFALNNAVEPLNDLKVRQAINYAVSRKDIISVIHVNTAVELASELKAVGINMEIKQVDWATWLDTVYTGRQYETTVIALTSDYAPYDVLDRYQSTASGNFINYKNDKVDELMAKIPTVSDTKQKTELYHQVLKLLTDDACSVYLQDPATITAVSTRLEGYSVYPMYVQDMSQVKPVTK